MTHSSTKNPRGVLVIGLGLSGQAAVRFLLKRGYQVTGMDRSQSLLINDAQIAALCSAGMLPAHESDVIFIDDYELVVVSPGIPKSHPYYQKALDVGLEVIGEVELACRGISKKCLGVTGTNGKTTVTMLIAHIFNSVGIKARALGNIGIPLTTAVDEHLQDDVDIYVIELSSFQLETLTYPCLDAGVILNITPDHLDRYDSLQHYAQAKVALHTALKSDGDFFVEERCFHDYHNLFAGKKIITYGYSQESLLRSDTVSVFMKNKEVFVLPVELQKKYSHDVENIMAAYAMCATQGITAEQFIKGIKSFKKPSHRIEFVTDRNGVRFYDDSKGTNIDAVIRAVDSFNENIILIAGGVDKGAPYSPWIKAFNGKVKVVYAIGQSASKIKGDLQQHIPVEICADLNTAVTQAAAFAEKGDVVLLSPGCSSYDMFKDYAHRGKEFQRMVNAL